MTAEDDPAAEKQKGHLGSRSFSKALSEALEERAAKQRIEPEQATQLNRKARSVFAEDGHHVLDGDHEQSIVALEVDWNTLFGVKQDAVVLLDWVVLIVLHLGTDRNHSACEGGNFDFIGKVYPTLGLLAVFVFANQHPRTDWFHGFQLGCLRSFGHGRILGRIAWIRPWRTI